MRSQKDVENSLRHNERKFSILSIIAKSKKHLKPRQIASLDGITVGNALRQLTKLHGQGYLWRKKSEDGTFGYRHLKPQGERTLKALWIRAQIKTLTGDESISLNLDDQIPVEYWTMQTEMEEQFYTWRYT